MQKLTFLIYLAGSVAAATTQTSTNWCLLKAPLVLARLHLASEMGESKTPVRPQILNGGRAPIPLNIGDPHAQLKGERPFSVIEKDGLVPQRLELVNAVLESKDDRVKVFVDRWNTLVVKASAHPEYFSREELDSPARISIVFLHPLDENPQIALQGITSQLMFDCMHDLPGPFQKLWRDQMAANMRSLNAKKADHPELAQVLRALGPLETERQIEEVAKLRTAWLQKFDFYSKRVNQFPELRNSAIPPEKADGKTKHDLLVETEGTPTHDELMLNEFLAFYGSSSSQNLDPILVREAWRFQLPPLWESPMAAPSLVALPQPKTKQPSRGQSLIGP